MCFIKTYVSFARCFVWSLNLVQTMVYDPLGMAIQQDLIVGVWKCRPVVAVVDTLLH